MLGLWELDRSLSALLPLLHLLPLSAAAAPPMPLPSRAATVSVTKTWAESDVRKNYRRDTLADGNHRPQPVRFPYRSS
jgi:hypothetical protein